MVKEELMNRANKAGEWKEMLVLTEGDLLQGSPKSGPAVRVTFASYGREVRYSHTPGVVDEGGFRSVQHIHDRNVGVYRFLFLYGNMAVDVAKQLDPKKLADHPHIVKKLLMDTHKDIASKVEGCLRKEDNLATFPQKKESPRPSLTKPTLGVSIGEILKARRKEDG